MTKRYLLSYCEDQRAHIALFQYNEGDVSINERLVLVLSQELLNNAPVCYANVTGLNTVQERPLEEDQ